MRRRFASSLHSRDAFPAFRLARSWLRCYRIALSVIRWKVLVHDRRQSGANVNRETSSRGGAHGFPADRGGNGPARRSENQALQRQGDAQKLPLHSHTIKLAVHTGFLGRFLVQLILGVAQGLTSPVRGRRETDRHHVTGGGDQRGAGLARDGERTGSMARAPVRHPGGHAPGSAGSDRPLYTFPVMVCHLGFLGSTRRYESFLSKTECGEWEGMVLFWKVTPATGTCMRAACLEQWIH